PDHFVVFFGSRIADRADQLAIDRRLGGLIIAGIGGFQPGGGAVVELLHAQPGQKTGINSHDYADYEMMQRTPGRGPENECKDEDSDATAPAGTCLSGLRRITEGSARDRSG